MAQFPPVFAAVALIIVPGPDMIYMLGRCVAQGRKAGILSAIDVLNPKVALFFLALLPQFIDRNAAHPTLQILLLGVTVNAIGLPINIALACCSARLTAALRRNQSASQWLQRGLGGLFVALGLRIAIERI